MCPSAFDPSSPWGAVGSSVATLGTNVFNPKYCVLSREAMTAISMVLSMTWQVIITTYYSQSGHSTTRPLSENASESGRGQEPQNGLETKTNPEDLQRHLEGTWNLHTQANPSLLSVLPPSPKRKMTKEKHLPNLRRHCQTLMHNTGI